MSVAVSVQYQRRATGVDRRKPDGTGANSGRAVAVLRTAASSANVSSNYSNEPMTIVEFVLTDAEGGVLLTVTESGFDGIPLARRAAPPSLD